MPRLDVRKYADLGAAIRQAREQQGVTQKNLADRLGFGAFYLQDLEAGTKPILFITRLFRVLRALDMRISVTWGGPDEDDVNGSRRG